MDFPSIPVSGLDWAYLAICAVIVGLAKTGVVGVYHIVVPVLAMIFGGKDSTGYLLPILILADIVAVVWYRRATQWRYILKIYPAALMGLLIAVKVGDSLTDEAFQTLIGLAVLTGLVIMWYMETRADTVIPGSGWFAASLGLLAGFATMIGNAAGPFMAVYLLAMRLPKNAYIGTIAWFFFLINLTKLPFHIYVWQTISLVQISLGIMMIPAIAAGAIAGIRIVQKIPEYYYRPAVIIATILSALLLLI